MYVGWVRKGPTAEYREKKKKKIHLPFASLDLDTSSESVTEIRFHMLVTHMEGVKLGS